MGGYKWAKNGVTGVTAYNPTGRGYGAKIPLMEEFLLATWDVENPVNTMINYQPHLVSRISEPSTVPQRWVLDLTSLFNCAPKST